MRLLLACILLSMIFFSCAEEQTKNETSKTQSLVYKQEAFFYPYDTIPRVYQYRDIVHGMREHFHRVYGIRDAYGAHIIVEKYVDGRRLTEAYKYKMDSLKVVDHMVVNGLGKNEKAMIYRNDLFPKDTSEIYFASKFSGLTDSTVLFYETFRKFNAFEKRTIMNQKTDCMKLNEVIRITNMDVSSKMESQPMTGKMSLYFGKGLGLVEWYDENKARHFVLEGILNQQEWIKLMSR